MFASIGLPCTVVRGPVRETRPATVRLPIGAHRAGQSRRRSLKPLPSGVLTSQKPIDCIQNSPATKMQVGSRGRLPRRACQRPQLAPEASSNDIGFAKLSSRLYAVSKPVSSTRPGHFVFLGRWVPLHVQKIHFNASMLYNRMVRAIHTASRKLPISNRPCANFFLFRYWSTGIYAIKIYRGRWLDSALK